MKSCLPTKKGSKELYFGIELGYYADKRLQFPADWRMRYTSI